MTQPDTDIAPPDVLFHVIIGFMLPFFIVGAAGDTELARAAIVEFIDAYDAASMRELDLIGRIIGFSTVATDNLRLSMQPDLPDSKILRYRSGAVSLSRSADRCQAALDKIQAARRSAPMPLGLSIAPLQPATTEMPTTARLAADAPPVHHANGPSRTVKPTWSAADIDTMQHEARVMLEALRAGGVELSAAAQRPHHDPLAARGAVARAALAAAGFNRIDFPANVADAAA